LRVFSIRNRLTLLFVAIVAAAISVVYFYVVPQLEERLQNRILGSLAGDARAYSGTLTSAIGSNESGPRLDRRVRQAADRANARVTLLGVTRGTQGVQTYVISDSTDQSDLSDLQFQVAADAVEQGKTVTGSEASNAGRLGQAAKPLYFNGRVARVVVFSEPLREVAADVRLIRRQIIVAGLIALGIAALLGYLVASALTRRIGRLEEAAEKVAAGDFSQRIPIDRDDELGELAMAFNEMQAQLKQLDDARKRFIATASHELRTPIFSLSGFAELLADEDLDAETRREFLAQIREQTDRLRALATDLLDLSRLEAGSLDLRPEDVDVGGLARDVCGEFVPALQQHRSDLAVELPPTAIEARCDPERVAQIVRILIDNAISHTPPGTPIEVSAGRENGSVQVAVEDRGLGIKRSEQGRLFDPFYTSNPQGSGLGLTIARELAERMEGHLSVKSVPGRTTFTLELPT
jgi:two-component system, OmpR family, sensor kinase